MPKDSASVREADIASYDKAKEAGYAANALLTAEEMAAYRKALGGQSQEYLDLLKQQREQRMANEAFDRASSDSVYDFNNRPSAPQDNTGNYILYYAWVGGATSGEWKLYRAPNTPENQAKYGSRAIGGETQASLSGKASDANALISQPMPTKDAYGNITGWTVNGKSVSANGTSLPTGSSSGSGNGVSFNINGSGSGASGGGFGSSTGASSFTASDGTSFNNQTDYQLYQSNLDAKKQQRVSAYNVLYNEFNKYGLGSLVSDIKNYLIDNTFDPSEFSIQLQNTDAYKKRFAANQDRINKGLTALTPAQYINLEDQYQEIMRRYGLPASYYTKGDLGIQEGFNKLISNDVSAKELEDRVMTAQNRLINTDVNTLNALRQFYPNITNGDLLAYTLDPSNAINDIKRKATAAEIGGAALAQGLAADVTNAEDLAKYGINKAQAQEGYSTIGQILPTASQLGDIYAKQGLGPYNQATAEAEFFNTANAAEAARKRKRLAELERATFGGSAGTSGNALNRDRAMTNQMLGTPGAGQF